MNKIGNPRKTSQEIEDLYIKEENLLLSSKDWLAFNKSYNAFYKNAVNASLPFDPRFNAVHWGFGVKNLFQEIVFSYCWMKAYATYYKGQNQTPEMATIDLTTPIKEYETNYKDQEQNRVHLSNIKFHVSYFADNSITRIDSCRDKIALMIWSFYCPFNPEKRNETLNYEMVLDRLKHPLRFGLSLKNHQVLVSHLEMLHGQEFDNIVKYRNLKIHRMEPRIEISGIMSHHGWNYMFPLYEKGEIDLWKQELRKLYPDKKFQEQIKNFCYIDGVLYDQRRIKDSIWNYEDVQTQIWNCLCKLLQTTTGCYDILRKRAPLRKNRNIPN